jgi:outer membrane protein OmpA-like peptidoglycan-associated protein
MRVLILCVLLAMAIGCNKKIKKIEPLADPVVVVTPPVQPDTGTIPFIVDDPVVKPPVIMPIEIRDTVYFDFDSDDIRSDQIAKLIGISTRLKHSGITELNLLGGASPEGAELYNYSLSMRRSEAVKQFLGMFGVIKYYINGKGETDLVSNLESEWWRNRNCIISVR